MTENWEETLRCASGCTRCGKAMDREDPRILSVYDHQPICLECKKDEEERPDYQEASRQMIGRCMVDIELTMKDPGGYCFHHFYPYRCE